MPVIEDTVEIHASTYQEAFDKLEDLIHRMFAPVEHPALSTEQWQNTIDVLEGLHEQYFVTGTDPNGVAWEQLKPSTIRKKGHGIILVLDEKLLDSLTQSNAEYAIREVNGAKLTFGTSRPWAELHQSGGKRVPQRMHTGLGEQNVSAVSEVIADTMIQLMFDVRQ